MDLKRYDFQEFLYDVRAHFRASLETSEYENSSNIFHVTAAEETEKLLERCEFLLEQYAKPQSMKMNGCTPICSPTNPVINGKNSDKDTSYLDMAPTKEQSALSSQSELQMDSRNSAVSDKTFRSSVRVTINEKSLTNETTRAELSSDDEDLQIYDICEVSQVDVDADETQKAITPDLDLTHTADCPYMDLPAGHLAIQRSTKYGQLQRIEKRMFFDQTKKCYCGILNDWLLCYADGPTSAHPSTTLHLKSPGIEIEHSGEGKRREICFQITTADPSKKLVFQAVNEVDAKEWIHAIEAAIRAIRGADSALLMKNGRKLPTPPVIKKLTFLGNGRPEKIAVEAKTIANDCIYEEPSPIYNCSEPKELLINNSKCPPNLPVKNTSPTALAKKFEYDIPKLPPQPLSLSQPEPASPEADTLELLNKNDIKGPTLPKFNDCSDNTPQVDFQTKVKDMHNKLSSQLSAGPGSVHLKKAVKKTYSGSSTESEVISLTNSPQSPSPSKEQKKQKKSNSPDISPQKPIGKEVEKTAKNWFLNRLNKTTSCSISRCGNINGPTNGAPNSKCKQSEKENLLGSLDIGDNCDATTELHFNTNTIASSTSQSPKSEGKGKCRFSDLDQPYWY